MPDFRGQLTARQRETLLQPIKPFRVSKDGKGFSHLESFEVKAHLNRLFGFEGWSTRIDSLTVLFEAGDAGKWSVGYLCTMTLSVFTVEGVLVKESADASTGDATNQRTLADAHDLAVKSAVSGALKRCATALGDQFGLSLYAKGSMESLVKRVVPYEEEAINDGNQDTLL